MHIDGKCMYPCNNGYGADNDAGTVHMRITTNDNPHATEAPTIMCPANRLCKQIG